MIKKIKSFVIHENTLILLFAAVFWFSVINNRWTNTILILLVLFSTYVLATHQKAVVVQYLKQSKFIYFFLLLWVPLLLSTFESVALKNSIRYDLNMLRFLFIGIAAIALNQTSLEKIRYLLLLFIVVISLDAVVEWLTGYHLLGVSRDRKRIMGLFSYYHLGYYLATLTPIIFYQCYQSMINKRRDQFFWLMIALCSVISIFIAGSRAGWVTLTVSLGLLLFWGIIQKKISLKLVGLVLVVLSIFSVGIFQTPIVKDRFVNPNGAASIRIGSYEWFNKISSDRFVLWEFAWKEYKENPILGAGINTYRETFNAQEDSLKGYHADSTVNFPHLHILEVMNDTGTVGLLGYIVVLIGQLYIIFRSKEFSYWLAISFLAMMPINTHASIYGSFWAVLIWIPLILGLREKYLLMHSNLLKKY